MCLRLLQYEVLEGRTEFWTAADAARGSATHDAAARNLLHRIARGSYLSTRKVADAAADAWETHAFMVNWPAEESRRGEVKDQVIAMSLAHARTIANDVVPIDAERKIEAEVPEVGANVVGRIDLVSRPLFLACAAGPWGETVAAGRPRQIRDLKTKASAPPGLLNDDADQLIVYQLVCRALGEPASDLLVDYTWAAGGGKVRTIAVPDEADRTPIVVQELRTLVRIYESGLFPRTGRGSWKCNRGACPHYDYCILGPGRLDL